MEEKKSINELIELYHSSNKEDIKSDALKAIKSNHRISFDDYKEFTKKYWDIGWSNKVEIIKFDVDKLKQFIVDSEPSEEDGIERKNYLLIAFPKTQSVKDFKVTLSISHLFDIGFSCFPMVTISNLLNEVDMTLQAVYMTKGFKTVQFENRPIKEYTIAILICKYLNDKNGKIETIYYDIVEDPNGK